MSPPPDRLPDGFRIRLDSATRRIGRDVLAGGSPRRYLRLSAAGMACLADLETGGVDSGEAAGLARSLTDAGLAHPLVTPVPAPDATVLIPVRDRADLLDQTLAALGGAYPVLVVDDGSLDPAAVAAVCGRYGAGLLRRPSAGGPGAARNSGWPGVSSELVVFCDSDVRPGAGWVEALAGHFADPSVAAVAPRVAGEAPDASPLGRYTVVGRYAEARSAIDVGERRALVAPTTRVAYVPTAALVVRRAALEDVGGFDPALRYGEDVDLVWRLIEAGWRVRYDPGVVVRHREPETWAALWRRRFRYGTSAAPLAQRHPDDLFPLVVHPVPASGVLAVLAVPGVASALVALAGYGVAGWFLRRRLRSLPLPASEPWALAASGVWQTWLGLGRWGAQFGGPLLAAAGALGGGRRRRLLLAALVASPPLVDWARRPVALDPLRYSAAWLADEAAYGLGVTYGCWRGRRWRALRPRLAMRGAAGGGPKRPAAAITRGPGGTPPA